MIICAFAESGTMASIATAATKANLRDMMFLRPAERCICIVEMMFWSPVIEGSVVKDLSQVVIGRVRIDFFKG
jgi:hypothetical protein